MFATNLAVLYRGGPPHETWSAARHPAVSDDRLAPRPLRSRTLPWGLPRLRPRERLQLQLGNKPMQEQIFLLSVCQQNERAAVMPCVANLATEGRTLLQAPEILQILARPGAALQEFDQCPFGAAGQTHKLPPRVPRARGRRAGRAPLAEALPAQPCARQLAGR